MLEKPPAIESRPELVAAAARVDGVITQLDDLIADTVRRGSRIGFFAAIYRGVTVAVRDAILADEFDDGPRMALLDETFARRFLEAHDRWRSGRVASRCWVTAFDASTLGDLTAIQHLLLGVNAHIGLDLGAAAATVAPGDALSALQADFDRINNVLDGLVPTDRLEFDRLSPGIAELDRSGAIDGLLARLGLHITRAEAWHVAEHLAVASDVDATLDVVDQSTTARARHITHPDVAVRELLERLVLPKERTDIGSAITSLL